MGVLKILGLDKVSRLQNEIDWTKDLKNDIKEIENTIRMQKNPRTDRKVDSLVWKLKFLPKFRKELKLNEKLLVKSRQDAKRLRSQIKVEQHKLTKMI